MKTQMQVVQEAIERLDRMSIEKFYDSLVKCGIVTGEEKYSVWGCMGVDYDNHLLSSNLPFKSALVKKREYERTWRIVFLK